MRLRNAALARMETSIDFQCLDSADIVIEAATENTEFKRASSSRSLPLRGQTQSSFRTHRPFWLIGRGANGCRNWSSAVRYVVVSSRYTSRCARVATLARSFSRAATGIELTRSRAYTKNDQAWVEQKNGSVVRRLVGPGSLRGLVSFITACLNPMGVWCDPVRNPLEKTDAIPNLQGR